MSENASITMELGIAAIILDPCNRIYWRDSHFL
jgi:hypothetical protein